MRDGDESKVVRSGGADIGESRLAGCVLVNGRPMSIFPSSFSTKIGAQSEENKLRDVGGMRSKTTEVVVGIQLCIIDNSILAIGSFATELNDGS